MNPHRLHTLDLQPLRPRAALPAITDEPKREWAAGWWQGISCGVAIGFGLAVMLVRG